MRYLLLIGIKIYWFIIPEKERRSCIFRESCSQHVYKLALNQGLFSGLKALIRRMRSCKPGYTICLGENGIELILCDGSILTENEIAFNLLNTIKCKISNKVNTILDCSS